MDKTAILLLILITILFIIFLIQFYLVRSNEFDYNDTKRIISIALNVIASIITIVFLTLSIK